MTARFTILPVEDAPPRPQRARLILRRVCPWALGAVGLACVVVFSIWFTTTARAGRIERNERQTAECIDRGGTVITDKWGYIKECWIGPARDVTP